VIEVAGISKSYGAVKAVRGVTFTAPAGQVTGLLGANGAGKTTTIRIITGFLPPDTGAVRVCGADTFLEARRARAQIGYLPESAPSYGEMPVGAFLRFRGRLYGLRGRKLRQAVDRAVDRCWLREVRRRRIGTLSKGYRQRVGLAAAILHEPQALILDEPTNGLDPHQIRESRTLIRELAQDRTVLISSHILPEIERTCDRVVMLAQGEARAQGALNELLEGGGRGGARGVRGVPVVLEARAPEGGWGAADALRATLEQLAGVASVQVTELSDGWRRYRCEAGADGGDLRQRVAGAASGLRAPIRELRLERTSLESLFLEVTEAREGALGASSGKLTLGREGAENGAAGTAEGGA
jgi:ABC-2 type transport system ATP-binding protein